MSYEEITTIPAAVGTRIVSGYEEKVGEEFYCLGAPIIAWGVIWRSDGVEVTRGCTPILPFAADVIRPNSDLGAQHPDGTITTFTCEHIYKNFAALVFQRLQMRESSRSIEKAQPRY